MKKGEKKTLPLFSLLGQKVQSIIVCCSVIKTEHFLFILLPKLENLFVVKKDWGRGFKEGFEKLNTPPLYKNKKQGANKVKIR